MEKRGRKLGRTQKLVEFSNSEISNDSDFLAFKELLSKLKGKYKTSTSELFNYLNEEILIPSSIFISELSPLETLVKYLKENLGLDYTKIGEILGRNKKTIWQAYKNSIEKYPKKIEPKETKYNIPVSEFKTELSVLEAATVYLKEQFGISYHQIGELLQRNERTIWTVYNRAQKKNG